jgi:methyl-accepting chemotaxis protein
MLMLLGSFALFAGIGAGFYIFGSITDPLNKLQEAIKTVRKGGKVEALSGFEGGGEFSEMGQSVKLLLSDQIYAREKADLDRQKAEAENESLNNSVIALLQAVDKLSRKDLTERAPVSRDIIGTVSDAINQLTDETSKVLHGVNLIASQVAEASGKVRSQGEMVSKTSEDERKNVGEMIQSLSEATQSMNHVAVLADQSNRSAERATQATDTALATVNSTVKGMESIRETIAETEKRIKRLGERSQEISGIVNLINTISERTHVLALNASMQAAVAGEAGRGFAVVAEEVQRLAESSRNATQQISTLVNNIQLETNETISTVNRTIGQVVQGSEQAQKAGEQMRLTQGITSELVEQVRRITEASELQKGMSAQLLQSVQRLGQSNERTAQQIDTQSQETQSLLDSAQQLVASVNVFKLPRFA